MIICSGQPTIYCIWGEHANHWRRARCCVTKRNVNQSILYRPYEGYFCVCLGCHNLHLHYKRLSNLPFLISREYKNTLFYFKCEIKNKQPFENMWSKYIKESFYLYIACFWIKNYNFGRFVFQICLKKKRKKNT